MDRDETHGDYGHTTRSASCLKQPVSCAFLVIMFSMVYVLLIEIS